MSRLQNRLIRGIDGNWDHVLQKHGLTEAEAVSVFKSNTLRPLKNKKKGSADYLVQGKTFTGKNIKVCYSWDDERKGWIWIHTAF